MKFFHWMSKPISMNFHSHVPECASLRKNDFRHSPVYLAWVLGPKNANFGYFRVDIPYICVVCNANVLGQGGGHNAPPPNLFATCTVFIRLPPNLVNSLKILLRTIWYHTLLYCSINVAMATIKQKASFSILFWMRILYANMQHCLNTGKRQLQYNCLYWKYILRNQNFKVIFKVAGVKDMFSVNFITFWILCFYLRVHTTK